MTIRKFRAKALPVFKAIEIPQTDENLKDLFTGFMGHLPVQVEQYPLINEEGVAFQVYDGRTNAILNVKSGDWLVLDEADGLDAYDSTFPTLVDEL